MNPSEEYGAIVVYQRQSQKGKEVTAAPNNDRYSEARTLHANVVGRMVDGEMVYAAIFPHVKAGAYFVRAYNPIGSDYTTVDVFPGHEAEIDFR